MVEKRRIIVCDGCEDTYTLSDFNCVTRKDWLYLDDKNKGWSMQGKLFLCPECTKKWKEVKTVE